MKKSTRTILDQVAIWLLVIGGLNWGLSLVNTNLISMIANVTMPVIGTIIYGAVGISALWVGGRAIMSKLMK